MALYAPRRSPRRRTTLVLPPPRQPVGARFNAIRHRVESINRIPPHLISKERRDELVTLAELGRDVRAWFEWAPRALWQAGISGTWYLWIGEALDPRTLQPGCKLLLGTELV